MNPTIGTDQKRLATVTARCALAGITLHRIEDDRGRETFIVTRWALTRELQTLDDVEQWLERVAPTRSAFYMQEAA